MDILRAPASYDPDIKIDLPEKSLQKGVLILGGLFLCFTGLGALIGIPMIIFGVKMRPYQKGSWSGICPKCANALNWYAADANTAQGELSCPNCHVPIIFYAGEFTHTPPA